VILYVCWSADKQKKKSRFWAQFFKPFFATRISIVSSIRLPVAILS
jgi:hypothetical protein